MAAPSPTSGVTGDLQTVVAAQQALTVQLGQLIQQLASGSTALITAITALTTATGGIPAHYFYLGAAGSALINTGATTLLGIVVNNADGSGTTFTTVTLYDGTSTAGAVVGAITIGANEYTFGPAGIALATGLYVVAAGTPCDLTFIWK